MKFTFSTLFVKDLEESLQFYQEIIGLPLQRQFKAGPHMEIAFLGGEGAQIELIHDANKDTIDIGSDISWAFAVDSLDDMYEFVKNKNIPILSDIIQPAPSTRFFYIQDPNGMKIQLVENIG